LAFSIPRAESEAAKGGAQLSAAAQEREASLVATIVDLQSAIAAAENDSANKEDVLRCAHVYTCMLISVA